jgi:hypothetical protein
MFHFRDGGRYRLGIVRPGLTAEPVDFSRSRENGHDDSDDSRSRPRAACQAQSSQGARCKTKATVTQRS